MKYERDITARYFYQFGFVHIAVAETVAHAYLMTRLRPLHPSDFGLSFSPGTNCRPFKYNSYATINSFFNHFIVQSFQYSLDVIQVNTY